MVEVARELRGELESALSRLRKLAMTDGGRTPA
jgi:hypothetical protein